MTTTISTRTPNLHVSTHFMTNAERALYYRSVENYPYPLFLLLDNKDTRPILPSVTFDSRALQAPYGLTYLVDVLRLAVAHETGWKVTRKQIMRAEFEIASQTHNLPIDLDRILKLLDEITLANGYQFSQNAKTGIVEFRAI